MDIDPTHTRQPALRFVLSPSPTPASVAYTPTSQMGKEGAWLEVCPEGLVLAQEMAERVTRVGGGSIDSGLWGWGGHWGNKKHSQGKKSTQNSRHIVEHC